MICLKIDTKNFHIPIASDAKKMGKSMKNKIKSYTTINLFDGGYWGV